MTTPVIRVQAEDFDLATECARLSGLSNDVGAVASFVGQCRGENDSLGLLELEHYPGMAESQLEAIATQACARWPLAGLTLIHRFGKIAPGENIVLVAAASRHRDAAFDATRFVMDYLKTDAPFWKKEYRKDGELGEWVSARDADDTARQRWLEPDKAPKK